MVIYIQQNRVARGALAEIEQDAVSCSDPHYLMWLVPP